MNNVWGYEDSALVPILTDNLPAPLAFIESQAAPIIGKSVKKNGFTCTDMCKCLKCRNNNDKENEVNEDFDITDHYL